MLDRECGLQTCRLLSMLLQAPQAGCQNCCQNTGVGSAVTEGCFQPLPAESSMLLQAPKQAASRVSEAAPKAPGAEVVVAGAAALALVGGVGLAASKNDPASSSAPSGRRHRVLTCWTGRN